METARIRSPRDNCFASAKPCGRKSVHSSRSRSAIEQLPLPLPSLSDQHKLVALSRPVRQQADIETRLNALRMQELHNSDTRDGH